MFKKWNAAGFFAVVAAVALTVPAFGRTVKQARANDVASEYILENNGDLFRMVRGRKCQVTSHVLDFKVSQHPQDVAMAYFVKDESTANLFVIHNADRFGNCPKASTKRIFSDLAKKHGDYRYNVVSNTDTTIVNVALGRHGDFAAWDNNVAVLSLHNVADYVLHMKFGVRGAPYSSYVLFALNDSGYVLKVKGNDPQNSKWDLSERFDSLSEFKTKYRIQN